MMSTNLPEDGPIAFLNGKQIPFHRARLPVYDLGVMQGATLTERLRTVQHRPYLVDEHLDRLARSITAVSWNVPFDRNSFSNWIHQLAEINSRGLPPAMDLSVVIFITAGQGLADANGEIDVSQPTVCVYTAPLPFPRWAAAYREGVQLFIPSIRQIPAESLDPCMKHRSRLHWSLADQQARSAHPQGMALLLDQQGGVTETSSGNLFMVRKGTLWTPLAATTLPGIAQSHVIQLARSMGIPVERARMTPHEVMDAEEAFLTSSTYCLLPVSHLDGHKIGTELPGKLTRRLTSAWSNEIGLNFAQQAQETATIQ